MRHKFPADLGRRKRAELPELLRPCFARVEPWLQAGKYAAALMSPIPRCTGWTIAEQTGDRVAVPWLGYACGTCRYCLTGWETLCLSQRNTGDQGRQRAAR